MNNHFAVGWTRTAVADLLSIIDYATEQDGVESTERLSGQITNTAAGLETMPLPCRA